MSVCSTFNMLAALVFFITIFSQGDADHKNDIGCYINGDLSTFHENDTLTLLKGNDLDEKCLSVCKGTSANIAAFKWVADTDQLGMCSCLTLRPETQLYKVSCCEGKTQLRNSVIEYRVYNISLSNKQINASHFTASQNTELCDGNFQGVNVDSVNIVQKSFEKYSKEIAFKTALDDQKKICPNSLVRPKSKDHYPATKVFDAFFIPDSESKSKLCKLHCALKSRFTKQTYEYFTVITYYDNNFAFCECLHNSSIIIMKIKQCSHCQSDDCIDLNLGQVVSYMDSPTDEMETLSDESTKMTVNSKNVDESTEGSSVAEDANVLEVLSAVLSPASIICLVATILLFHWLKIINEESTRIVKHICYNLFIGNCLLFILVDREYFSLLGRFGSLVEVLTHYVFLAAFGWMAVQTFHLYRMVVEDPNACKKLITRYKIGAYAYPLLPISLKLVIGFEFDKKTDAGNTYFWLHGEYVWEFMIHVVIIFLENGTFILNVLWKYKRTDNDLIKKNLENNRKPIIGFFGFSFLLALTWGVGLFTLMDPSRHNYMPHVFIALNASQGIWIFISHCVLQNIISLSPNVKSGNDNPEMEVKLIDNDKRKITSPHSSRNNSSSQKSVRKIQNKSSRPK